MHFRTPKIAIAQLLSFFDGTRDLRETIESGSLCCILLAVGRFFFSAAPTAQNSPFPFYKFFYTTISGRISVCYITSRVHIIECQSGVSLLCSSLILTVRQLALVGWLSYISLKVYIIFNFQFQSAIINGIYAACVLGKIVA